MSTEQGAVDGERQGLLEAQEVYGPGGVGDGVAAVEAEEVGGCRVRVGPSRQSEMRTASVPGGRTRG